MTEQIYSQSARKILQNKKQIEDSLEIKLYIKSGIVILEGHPENEIVALEVIEAINLGFSVSQALDLKREDFIFEKILIKSIARRRNLVQVRGRVIGEERKVLRTIEYLTDCDIVLHGNTVGIIGARENVENASYALKRIIAGSEHANMYAWLEMQQARKNKAFKTSFFYL